MKDEIKEILDLKIDCDYKRLSVDEIVILKDYITNLQEENERFKARWKDTNVIIKDDKTLIMNTNTYNCLEDYNSRIEKAIEYINKLSNEPNVFGHYGIDYNCKKYLLKILKGE